MCTCLISGKAASSDGFAHLAANDDWDQVAGVLTHVPRALHRNEDLYTLTGGQTIPEVRETCGFSYTSCFYATGTLDRSWAGGMNDCGVAVAGTGVDAHKELPWEGLGYRLEPDDIPLLILRRGTSARQAVSMIADLIMQYGMRPSVPEGSAGTSAATFSIADAEEGWVLEVMPGRCFLAVRVPDDMVSVRVNAFGTHDADLTDPDQTIASPDLADYARGLGFWEGEEEHFDFSAAFGAESSPTEWGPEMDPMNLRRRWRVMQLLGYDEPEEVLRYMARPVKPVSVSDLMGILSDVYKGTPYDLTLAEEGGPYHNPFAEGMPDYALCRRGTVASIVTEYLEQPSKDTVAECFEQPSKDTVTESFEQPSKDTVTKSFEQPNRYKENIPILWTALGTPRMVPYIPVYTDIAQLPPITGPTDPESSDPLSLFYRMKTLSYLTEYRYDRNIGVTAAWKAHLEEEMRDALGREAAALSGTGCQDANKLRKLRTEFTARHLTDAAASCGVICGKLLKMY